MILTLLIILGALSFLTLVLCISIFNKMISLRNRFKNAFSQIDVQLKRRYDLIPNLVETAKTYMKHEKETLENVIAARTQAVAANKQAAHTPESGQAIKNLMGAENQLTSALGRLFAVSENYPTLKANETMAQLSEELTSTENRVSFARQAFNDAVMVYNTYKEKFPNLIVANICGFKPAELFELSSPEEKKAPKVSFG